MSDDGRIRMGPGRNHDRQLAPAVGCQHKGQSPTAVILGRAHQIVAWPVIEKFAGRRTSS